jgi:two-component system, cell cycle sensor histidine kinase and response regulator CckA
MLQEGRRQAPKDDRTGRAWRRDSPSDATASQRQAGLLAVVGPVICIAAAMLALLTLYESTKQLLFPAITIWQSHAMTILVGTALATALAFLVLRRQARLHRQASQAVNARLQAEEWLRDTLASLDEVVWSSSPDARERLYLSPAAERMYGRPLAEFFANPSLWLEVIHPEDRDRIEADVPATLAGKAADVEYRILRPDGEVRWVRASVRLARDAHGAPLRLDGIVADVTDRRRAEAELSRTADLLRAVADGTTDAVFVKDHRGRYLLFNEAAARFVGRPAADVIGRDDTELFDADSARQVMERDRRVMDLGQTETEEERLTAAGVTRTYLATKAPYRDVRGAVIGLIGVSRDISDRKLAEEALRQSEESYRELFENAVDAAYTLDLEGRVTSVNAAAERLTSYTSEELLKMKVSNLLSPSELERSAGMLQAKLTGMPRTVYQVELATKGGERRAVEITSRIIQRGGRPVGVQGVARDLTERKLLEEQLRQAQKMEAIGQLAGGVAHDFNNLLTVITGYGQLLLDRLPGGDPAREVVEEMTAAGDKAAVLTRQLLAFSRKTIIEPKILDLKAATMEAGKMLRRLIGEHIQLVTVADPLAGLVKADPGHVEQVILNLAVNARDAMPKGGRLTIEVRNVELDETYARDRPDARSGPHILLAVSDTGCGMDAATAARIWEPFFTTKGACGTGLGLATVYGIVKQSGGHVDVDSEVGRGSTFKVYLPRVEGRAFSAPSNPGLAAAPRGAEVVLLVEDEEGVRTLCRRVLAARGYTVLEAHDGADALRIASGCPGPIDLLLTDVVMPRMGGGEVAERLAALRPAIKVLFLSGYPDDAMVRHGILKQQFSFLQKPFAPAALTGKVRQVLDQQDAVIRG